MIQLHEQLKCITSIQVGHVAPVLQV